MTTAANTVVQFGVAACAATPHPAPWSPQAMNTTIPTALNTWTTQLDAAERAGPDADPLTVTILAGELRAAHQVAVRDRDTAAAILHRDHGWTWSRLSTVLFGRNNKAVKVALYVQKVLDDDRPVPKQAEDAAEAAFVEARDRANALWWLYRRAADLEKTLPAPALPDPPTPVLDLPAEPLARIAAAQEQLVAAEESRKQTIAARNRAAMALVVHGDWMARRAAHLVGTSVARINTDGVADDADPRQVVQLAQDLRTVGVLMDALREARDTAIRELKGELDAAAIAAATGVSQARVSQILA